jgi:hypothetical protein
VRSCDVIWQRTELRRDDGCTIFMYMNVYYLFYGRVASQFLGSTKYRGQLDFRDSYSYLTSKLDITLSL